MSPSFEELLLTAYQRNRHPPVSPPELFRRLQFVARMLRQAPPSTAVRRLLWMERNDVILTHTLGDETVLGRDPSCTIVLASCRVSRRHCAIHCDGECDEIVDLNSANGTQVNGIQIQSRVLADGDMIEIGGHAIVYTNAISMTSSLSIDAAQA